MNKKGFTLSEILVVIAIIGVIAVIAVPSVIFVNKRINVKLYNQKVINIEKAAELYASQNKSLFDGSSEVEISVADLINNNYLENDGKCGDSDCLVNPTDKSSLNEVKIILKQEALGVTAKVAGTKTVATTGNTLVAQVCERLNNGFNNADATKIRFTGKFGTGSDDTCGCSGTTYVKTKTLTGSKADAVSSCLIYGQEKNNYLSYDNVMWRVMGVYEQGDSGLVVKIINDDNVEITVQ